MVRNLGNYECGRMYQPMSHWEVRALMQQSTFYRRWEVSTKFMCRDEQQGQLVKSSG